MAQTKKGVMLLFLFIFLGAALGSILTAIFNVFVPSGPLAHIFLSQVTVGSLHPVTLGLVLLNLTFGLQLHINLLNILGMVMGYYVYQSS
ncbi:DUF4321 domain-containing protein [Leptospirillum ferriphilum]|uniref:DUF4321 domain-containing protein n=2 Tax=Leptospirillum TaxID=179 RepID=A0A094WHH3_9BACT|nr:MULTISPECIES: DUF4321 domain-containing protein [Leptospirillum]AKS22787.1 hypothetical protein ABH19_02010 [Leptospirillum sp. Group II 'CF-1']EDZ39463.1 MAG: Hypothetical protein CGL2_11277100 [Leptospirillum sp. Group II '5-way CG']EIJ77032.1 MAG: Hypothetical protein C75L2_00030029 [Leptospirillum sp. Group II 'C75']KGA95132.1 hypothetical protein LptCag_2566 [Leptospirillum ferriphilum]